MVIISEIVNLTDIVTKATSLLLSIPENWYKGTSEIESFKSNLSILRLKSAQWDTQLNQFGMGKVPGFQVLLKRADELLDEWEQYCEGHRNKRFWNFKRKAFPGKLTYIMAEILKMVEAGPELLVKGIESHELLTKRFGADIKPLPFGPDRRYVPLQGMVEKVQRALEDSSGPQVVTLYGELGIGKSSLAKYVALHYQESARESASRSFDGVYYMFCGQSCNIRQLRNAFFSNRGFATMEPYISGGDGDYHMPSYQSALRHLLAGQRLLIILNDVWEEEIGVLDTLISVGTPGKYLVTSQTRDIRLDALKIKVSSPTDKDAFKIVISHTERLSSGGQTSSPTDDCQLTREIHEVLRKVQNHPLSLVNVAAYMGQSEATDPTQWLSLRLNILSFLDENMYSGRIRGNERRYSLSVSASMMLMIESLPETERALLFLVALLDPFTWDTQIPYSLIKVFSRRFRYENPRIKQSNSTPFFAVQSGLQRLEDKSLVELLRYERYPDLDIKSTYLTIHKLRRNYIRQKRSSALQSIASDVLRTDDHQSAISVSAPGDDQSLAAMLGALHFCDAVVDEVTAPIQRVMSGVLPRSLDLEQRVDVLEIVKSFRAEYYKSQLLQEVLRDCLEMLHLEGEEAWKKQAHACASKIIVKLVCQKELDDATMAALLTISNTRALAFDLLHWIYRIIYWGPLRRAYFLGKHKSFSETHPKSWSTVLDLQRCISEQCCNDGFFCFNDSLTTQMLQYESEETLLAELQKLCDAVDQSSDRAFRTYGNWVIQGLHRSRLTYQMLHGRELQKRLPSILWREINDAESLDEAGASYTRRLNSRRCCRAEEENVTYVDLLECVVKDKDYLETMLTFPVSCHEWLANASVFRRLLGWEEIFGPGSLLAVLSGTPEFQAKTAGILKEDCWEEDFTEWSESYSFKLARFWGNVALVPDLHKATVLKLVIIAKEWIGMLTTNAGKFDSGCVCNCNLACDGEDCWAAGEDFKASSDGPEMPMTSVKEVIRTLTIINHLHAKFMLDMPPVDGLSPNGLALQPIDVKRGAIFCLYCVGQAEAYVQMKMYAEAMQSLEPAQQIWEVLQTVSILGVHAMCFEHTMRDMQIRLSLRSRQRFLEVLSKDHQGSQHLPYQQGLRKNDDFFTSNEQFPDQNEEFAFLLGTCGVLFRLAEEYSKAIHHFNDSLKQWEDYDYVTSSYRYVVDPRHHNFVKCRLLDHRGYAKYLKGDFEGAKLDMQSATKLKASKKTMEPISWEWLSNFRLDFRFVEPGSFQCSLLQLPSECSLGISTEELLIELFIGLPAIRLFFGK